MDDDFNTPEAVAVLFELASEVLRNRSGAQAGLLRALGGVLGLLQRSPNDFLQGGVAQGGLSAEQIEALIAERAAAKEGARFCAFRCDPGSVESASNSARRFCSGDDLAAGVRPSGSWVCLNPTRRKT